VLRRGNGSAESEGDQVRRAQAGEALAFDGLVELHTPRLYQMVRRFSSDRGEAEAIVQETWLRAWRALPGCDASRPIFPWLARIAMNAATDAWRRTRSVDFADLESEELFLPDDEPGPEQALQEHQAAERLARGVERLRPEQRAVIALRYDGALSYDEIARTLAIPVNTVRTHLHRAKAALKGWMEAEDAGQDG
jgi:RNA polymerase sigma-70 factor (ECF subfamily)